MNSSLIKDGMKIFNEIAFARVLKTLPLISEIVLETVQSSDKSRNFVTNTNFIDTIYKSNQITADGTFGDKFSTLQKPNKYAVQRTPKRTL